VQTKGITYEQVKSAYSLVHCLHMGLRKEIIVLLHHHLELTAAQVAKQMKIDDSLAHHHLRMLAEVGIVDQGHCPTAATFKLNYLRLTRYLTALKAL